MPRKGGISDRGEFMHILEFAGFLIIGAMIGFSIAVIFQAKIVATKSELQEWHAQLGDILSSDEVKAKRIAATLKNDLRQKLTALETKI